MDGTELVSRLLVGQSSSKTRFGDQPLAFKHFGVFRDIKAEGLSYLVDGLPLKTGFQVAMELHFRDVFDVHD